MSFIMYTANRIHSIKKTTRKSYKLENKMKAVRRFKTQKNRKSS